MSNNDVKTIQYPECCQTRERVTTIEGKSLIKVSGENAA